MSKDPGKEKDQYVVFQPAQKQYYVGCTIQDPNIVPVEVGGTWYPARPERSSEKPGKVVLHFHGGAYAVGDGRIDDAGCAAKNLIKNTDASHVFCPQYRLVSHPNSRFPAQLQDAISSYTYLISAYGVQPSQIIVSGDSAGANLAMGLLRYLADHGAEVGLDSPACAWLWSLWASPYETLTRPESWSNNAYSGIDYVGDGFGIWGASLLAPDPKTGMSLDHPNTNFIDHHFKSQTPMWFQIGGFEALQFDIMKAVEGMRKVEGNTVDVHITKDVPHDILLMADKLSFTAEAEKDAVLANEFLRSNVRS